MQVHELTRLATSLGGKRIYPNTSTHAWYMFPSEVAVLRFKGRIPYISVWGGDSPDKTRPECVTVHTTQVKDY